MPFRHTPRTLSSHHSIQFHACFMVSPLIFLSMPFFYYTTDATPLRSYHCTTSLADLFYQLHNFTNSINVCGMRQFLQLFSVYLGIQSNTIVPEYLMHLSICQQIMDIHIKESKTDPFRSGTTIQLAAISNHVLCPVRAMHAYLAICPLSRGPLFALHNGDFLTSAFYCSFFWCLYPTQH